MSEKQGRRARSFGARSREMDLLFGYSTRPDLLLTEIQGSPEGISIELDGVHFEWGNIKRLVGSIRADRPVRPFELDPTFVCHVDHLAKSRKLEIETDFKLVSGSISSSKSKVDVLLVDANNQPYYVSFKDADTPGKLGQVSGETTYGSARLKGGIETASILPKVPNSFTYADTGLSSEQFRKLNKKDQKLAFYKRNFQSVWDEIVAKHVEDSYNQIRTFCQTIELDRRSLISFVGTTFAGDLWNSEDFYVVVGDQPIQLRAVINQLSREDIEVRTELHRTVQKSSWIVWIYVSGKKYCLTKIESAFDGARTEVSQTKGIVFYFQQFGDGGANYKQLLVDVLK